MNYYNEYAAKPAAALRQLIADGLIPMGEVDDRSIKDVRASDLRGFTQCHFFAGIGGWSQALALASWRADRPVWTGSCPCQPFSGAGEGKGGGDDRHLWPALFALIEECRPAKIFGEQVDKAVPHGWIDRVFTDLESRDYACAAALLPACGADAPHLRNRLWFVGDSEYDGCAGSSLGGGDEATHEWISQRSKSAGELAGAGGAGDVSGSALAYTSGGQLQEQGRRQERGVGNRETGEVCTMADSQHVGWEGGLYRGQDSRWEAEHGHAGRGSAMLSGWGDSRWIACGDGKIRRIPTVESGIRLLAYGVPERVGLLAAAGNAIVPEIAARFIRAAM